MVSDSTTELPTGTQRGELLLLHVVNISYCITYQRDTTEFINNKKLAYNMPSLTKDNVEQLRAEFDRQLDVGLHHGAQLAVYVDGELVVNFAGGVDGPEGEQTTPEKRHLIFSCTKPLAGVGLHQLIESGDAAYDDPIVTHWPEFAESGTQKAEITIRQVLSHTAGVPYGATGMRSLPQWKTSIRFMNRVNNQRITRSTTAGSSAS